MIVADEEVVLRLRRLFDSSGEVYFRLEFFDGIETTISYADNSLKVLDSVHEYLFQTIFKIINDK